MENPNLDQTIPTTPKTEPQEEDSSLAETRAISLRPAADDPSLAQTRAVPVRPQDEDASLAETRTGSIRPAADDSSLTETQAVMLKPAGVQETQSTEIQAGLAAENAQAARAYPEPGPEEPTVPPLEFEGPASDQAGAPPALPPADSPPRKRRSWPLITFLGLLALLIVAGISGYSGYLEGIDLRQEAEIGQLSARVDEQFRLAEEDVANKEYFRARQRLEYVVQLDPDHPGVTDLLSIVLLELNTTATPTPVPTPTLTPTPDLRGVEELYSQGQQALANSDWTNAIDTLLKLRKEDPAYQTVAIDGMLFLALRNRGMDKIGKQADLEGGIYDLALAERFGPLDTEAQGFLTWSRLYITGASFWEIDWRQAVFYLEQVAPQLPSLRDGSGWTARERYRIALIGFGDQLARDDQWCDAAEKYELALSLGEDAHAAEMLPLAIKNCQGVSDENQPPPEQQPPQDLPPGALPTPGPAEDPPGEPQEPPSPEPPVDVTPAP